MNGSVLGCEMRPRCSLRVAAAGSAPRARARTHTHTPHRISAFLPNKSTCDCVQFYYQNKKCKYFKQVPGHV